MTETHAPSRQMFGQDTESFSKAHLKAMLFNVATKERVELIQGQMLAAMFFVSALLVNGGALTTGAAVGILQAFMSGSTDITMLSGDELSWSARSPPCPPLSQLPCPPLSRLPSFVNSSFAQNEVQFRGSPGACVHASGKPLQIGARPMCLSPSRLSVAAGLSVPALA